MRVINRTQWRTDHLKAILQRCAELEFDDGARRKGLVVTVTYTRGGGCSGHATLHGRNSTVRIANPTGIVTRMASVAHDDPRPAVKGWHTSNPDRKIIRARQAAINRHDATAMAELRQRFAHVACHEFAHNRGMQHGRMPEYYFWRGNWKPRVEWAAELPLEMTAAQKPANTVEARHVHAGQMLTRAITRRKRAAKLEQKWRHRVQYYERRAAALKASTS